MPIACRAPSRRVRWAVRHALVVDPLPRHASDVAAFLALAFDEPRNLFLRPLVIA
jgi:hypothetical protein